MNTRPSSPRNQPLPPSPAAIRGACLLRQGSTRILALLFAAVAAVLIVGAALYLRGPEEAAQVVEPSAAQPPGRTGLAPVTLDALRNLNSTVEIRFYALPGGDRGAEGLAGFIERVDGLLADFRRQSGGRVRVVRYDSGNRSGAEASAHADGIEPLSAGQRATGYLGLAVVSGAQKVSIPRLNPEWEAALEFDLTRAILRVTESKTVASTPVETSEIDPKTIEQVRRIIPNLESVSNEDGYRLLQSAALEEFREAAQSMNSQIEKAQQAVKRAQESGSEAQLKAALAELDKLQSEQTAQLQQIADDLQKQASALKRLKGNTTP